MFSKKESWSNRFFSILIVIVLYFGTRLINLNALPVFADEAIYVRWSQIIKNVETLRFIPLTDGKQPLFMWSVVPFLSFFTDPLIAARFVSVLSGFINLVFIFLTTCLVLYYKNPKTENPVNYILGSIKHNYYPALVSSLLYIFLPFSVFFDRLAVPDTLLTCLALISTYLTIIQSKYHRFDISIILGVCLGLAYMTKSPALYFIVLSCSFVCASSFMSKSKLFLKLFYSLLSPLISFLIYSFLRLGPQFHMIALRNKDYVWPISDILKHPLDPFKPHLLAFLTLYSSYVSLPFIFLFLLGLVIFLKKFKSNISLGYFYLLLVFIAPVFATISMAKVFTGRYVLFSLPYFIIILSTNLSFIKLKPVKPKLLALILFVVTLIPNLFFITRLLTVPYTLTLPPTEAGYINDWTSGWGIKDISIYLKNRSKLANVIVGTEGFFGTLPDGLQIYTDGTPQLTIVGVGVNLDSIPSNLIEAKNYGDEVYLLINPHRNFLNPDSLKKLFPISTYPRPDGTSLILYYLQST